MNEISAIPLLQKPIPDDAHGARLQVRENDDFAPIPFANGSEVLVNATRSELRLVDESKNVLLTIQMSPSGLILNLNAFQLNFNALDKIAFSAREISMEARENMTLKTGGDLSQVVQGNSETHVDGDSIQTARIQKITAELGNVEIKANDDVKIDGERVKLNCT